MCERNQVTCRQVYLSLVAVNSEEFKKRLHALLVMEEFCRKVAVKELHTISDRLVQSRARERCIERLKVQLKHKVPISTALNTGEACSFL